MSQRVLITGGAGFIGRHLIAASLERGHEVRVLDNFSTGRREGLEALPLEVIEGDIRDDADLERALDGTHAVLHHAALPSVPGSILDPVGYADVNITGTVKLAAACERHGVHRLVFASSSAVYGESERTPIRETDPLEPLSPYGAHKLTTEHLLRIASRNGTLDTVSLRYFNVFGPGQDPESAYAAAIPKFWARCRTNRPPVVFGDGGQTRDFIHVSDVAELNLLMLESDLPWSGSALNVGAGAATSILDLARAVMSLHGVTDAPEFEPTRSGDIRTSIADVSSLHTALAERGLAWQPRVSLEAGLAGLTGETRPNPRRSKLPTR